MYDYLIVGAGLTGCVLAERLASQLYKRVLIVDVADCAGGLAQDGLNKDGIFVHKAGLHVFHTNSQQVFSYLSQFTEWTLAPTRVKAHVDGHDVPFPFNKSSLNTLFGLNLNDERDVQAHIESVRAKIPCPRNAEEMALSLVGEGLYAKFFRGYTLKWWGVSPTELDPRVTSRIVVRGGEEVNYQSDVYQGLPSRGFTAMTSKMLSNPLITFAPNTDYRSVAGKIPFGKLIYTGSIDEFFDYRYGRLPYRSMRFEHQTLDSEYALPCHQVAYPNDHSYMRIFEFKHATQQAHPRTAIIREYPEDHDGHNRRDYPMPLLQNPTLYALYKKEAAKLKAVVFAGRLAEYRYYTMGQAVARALTLFQNKIAPSERNRSLSEQLPVHQ